MMRTYIVAVACAAGIVAQQPPSMQPTPRFCTDSPRTQTGFRLRYSSGRVRPASCSDLSRIGGCSHRTHGQGIRHACCLTCTGHQVSEWPTEAPVAAPTQYPTTPPGSPTRAPTPTPTHAPTPTGDICRTTSQGGGLQQSMCRGQTCNSTFPAITNIRDCHLAANLLNLPDTFAGLTNTATLPRGCYFKTSNFYNSEIGHHNTSLWFNLGGNYSLVDSNRLSVCGTVPDHPTSAPTVAPTTPMPTVTPTNMPTSVPSVSPSSSPTVHPCTPGQLNYCDSTSTICVRSPPAVGQTLGTGSGQYVCNCNTQFGFVTRVSSTQCTTSAPTSAMPTNQPTSLPTYFPTTAMPTLRPTALPTNAPTIPPTATPTATPTSSQPTTLSPVAVSASSQGNESSGGSNMLLIIAVVVIVIAVVVIVFAATKYCKKSEEDDATRSSAFDNPLYDDSESASQKPVGSTEGGFEESGYMDLPPADNGESGYMDINPDDLYVESN